MKDEKHNDTPGSSPDKNDNFDGSLEQEDTSVVDAQQQSTVNDKPIVKAFTPASRRVVVAVGILILAIIAGAAMIVSRNQDATPVTTNYGETQPAETKTVQLAAAISLTEGSVQFSSDGATWEDASGGETISESNHVRTGADSRAVLLIDDGSAVRLDQNTEVLLSLSETSSVEIMLVSGQVYSRVVPSESRSFAVITKQERFESLGTAFKTTTGESDVLEVYQSKVKVESSQTEIEEGNKYDTESKQKSDIDLVVLADDSFVQWNKQKDSENDDFKDKLGVLSKEVEEAPVEPPKPTAKAASISLTGSATDNGVKLNWTLTNASSTDGFKIVRDVSDTTPTYKENKSIYISSGKQRSYEIELHDGKTYNFRVCVYRAGGGTCDTYSNNISVKAPLKQMEVVQPGDVILNLSGQELSWTIGGTAPHGFKVLLSTEENPTYPSNSIQYVGAGKSSATLPDKSNGTYYVRVCKYTGEGCADYSNQKTYIVN